MTAWHASTSLPSTLTPGMPNPSARRTSGTAPGRFVGVEIAYWLFSITNTTGSVNEAAQESASSVSPWLVAPSPR